MTRFCVALSSLNTGGKVHTRDRAWQKELMCRGSAGRVEPCAAALMKVGDRSVVGTSS